ncbi:Uma2 family endonuclease [Streptomyces sp. URMC 124]|uniref:Uma2 family endonuclease n=1 Tax=Streptomyces sp. URMC 124 TaxID=3423405 RepID=UPI003F1E2111
MPAVLPDWFYPLRDSGWEADDLDHVPELPRHTDLIDGSLVLMTSPQRSWHDRVIRRLTAVLEEQVLGDCTAEARMTVRLDGKNHLEPDVMVAAVPYAPERTRFLPGEVMLVVEVVSDESCSRDRETKPFKYARAGSPHFWRIEIEDEGGLPAIHSYEPDETTRAYVATGIHRGRFKTSASFALEINLEGLVR